MKRHHRNQLARTLATRRSAVASLAACLVTGGSVAHADITTTLTGLPVTNESIPAGHGSTAETTVTWSADPEDTNWEQYAEWDGRGDVYQINDRLASILFVPASPLIKLTIDSFELDEWAGGGDTTANWSVTGSVSGLLASGAWNEKNTANDPNDLGGRTLISPNATGVPGESLTVLFDHSESAGSVSYLAMDNLTYSSMIVPEPGSAVMGWLGVTGLGAIAMRRRRA
jgi:MYXO-CTERM domain-containing protein